MPESIQTSCLEAFEAHVLLISALKFSSLRSSPELWFKTLRMEVIHNSWQRYAYAEIGRLGCAEIAGRRD